MCKLPLMAQRRDAEDCDFYLAVSIKKEWVSMNLDLYNAVFLRN